VVRKRGPGKINECFHNEKIVDDVAREGEEWDLGFPLFLLEGTAGCVCLRECWWKVWGGNKTRLYIK